MSESDKDGSQGQVDVAPSASSSYRKGGAFKRHCRRFWWVHLIIFCCITVLVVCLVIFVGVANIAQSKINDAKLEVQGVSVTKTTSNSYFMQINSTITTDGSVKANVAPFKGVMYLEDDPSQTPFVTVDFPATNADKHQTVNISQEVTIQDMDAFTKFNTWFFVNDTIKITVFGHTTVQPAGLDRNYGVTFKKTLTMNALNLLKGASVPVSSTKTSLSSSVYYNFNGTSVIPNQSVYTLDLGNVSFANFADDLHLGTLYIDNLLLKPGNNSVAIRGHMNQTNLLGTVTNPPYCSSGVVPVKLLGLSSVNQGQNLTYFADALSSANQTVPIDVQAILRQTQKLSLTCIS